MKLLRVFTPAVGFLLTATSGHAQTTGGADATATAYPPGSLLVESLALLVVVACVLTGYRFYNAIRGGRLARGWLWVFFGLVAFAFAQLLLCGGQLGILPLLFLWVDALRLVSLTLVFVGIGHLRKVLA